MIITINIPDNAAADLAVAGKDPSRALLEVVLRVRAGRDTNPSH